ncbi:MAG: zinc ribbon domain-containing protein [Anaerolineae bacterium]
MWLARNLGGAPATTPTCPHCGRPVQAEWRNCPYCGEPLGREG